MDDIINQLPRIYINYQGELVIEYEEPGINDIRYKLLLKKDKIVLVRKSQALIYNYYKYAINSNVTYSFGELDEGVIKNCILDHCSVPEDCYIHFIDNIYNFINSFKDKVDKKKNQKPIKSIGMFIIILFIVTFGVKTYFDKYAAHTKWDRESISSRYKWDTNTIYMDYIEWERDYKKVENEINSLQFEINSPEQLYNALETKEKINIIMDKLYIYVSLLHSINLEDDQPIEKLNLVNSLVSKAKQKFVSIDCAITKLSNEDIEKYLSDETLLKYQSYIVQIRNFKSDYASIEKQNIITQLSANYSIPEQLYLQLYQLKDENIDNKYFKSAMAYNLQCAIQNYVSLSKVKNYNSALEKALIEEGLEPRIYDDMINNIYSNFPFSDYINDRDVLRTSDEFRTINYEEGKVILLEALKPLGEQYISDMKNALNSNWIDVYPTKGKDNSSQYTISYYSGSPFISICYDDSVNSLLVLAHELGHAMHLYYSSKNPDNNYFNYTPSILISESVAQTNEKLVLKYLINNYAKNDKERLTLLKVYQNRLISSIYIQTLYSEFEKDLYDKVEKGEGISSEFLDEKWRQLKRKYKISFENKWFNVPHFYNNFYVYKYVMSNCIAEFFVKNLTEVGSDNDRKQYEKKYINFISCGSPKDAIELLEEMDINMNDSLFYGYSIEAFHRNFETIKDVLNK